MVEVIINGQYVEGAPEKIKYVKQANDLADVTTVNSSYSYSITLPKTPKNTRIFNGLGLVGNTSGIPYQKNFTQVIDNGSMIVSNGVSKVKETTDKYKLVVQDGIIDFFRSIENKSIGNDLDLSELSHVKNEANIIASFTNPNYRYLISEYNGWTVKNSSVNPDYQVPSINNKYIFDKIMSYAGYTYEGLPDISTDWTTFPSPPAIPTDEEIERFRGFYSVAQNIPNFDDWRDHFSPQWDSTAVLDTDVFELINNWELKAKVTANYRASFDVNGSMLYAVLEGNQMYTKVMPIKMSLFKNGVSLKSARPSINVLDFDFVASTNDRLYFYPETLTQQEAQDAGIDDERFLDALENGNFYIMNIKITSFNASISTMGIEVFDFGEAFKDYSMTEFIKEVMFRKSLTPFPDTDAKHIKFKTLSERVDTENYIDWTNRFVVRTKEEYQFGSYAIVNNLLMKHDNEDETFGNGSLIVNNRNLKDNTTLLQSKYYAPSGDLKKIRTVGGLFLELKFWEREIKDDDGTQQIEYKPLRNRYFMLREEWVNASIKIGETTTTGYSKASMNGTSLSDVVNEYYSNWNSIFDGLIIHDIELKLNQFDVNTLELDKPYYFEQEGAFYILNKLSYESGQLTKGEFLKIK